MAIERLPSERGTWDGKSNYPEIGHNTRVVHPHTGEMMTGPAFLAEVSQAKENFGRWPVPRTHAEQEQAEIARSVGETAAGEAVDVV